jgi:hypothetical protein
MKYVVGGEQSGDFLYFSTSPELPRTRVRQGGSTEFTQFGESSPTICFTKATNKRWQSVELNMV